MPGAAWRFGVALMVWGAGSGRARADDLFSCREIVTGMEMRQHPDALEDRGRRGAAGAEKLG